MATFNGHKNWSHWNISLWLSNDENMYRWVCGLLRYSTKKRATEVIYRDLQGQETPDGAKYSKSGIRAALVGWV